jgi:hypothetical protein
VARDRFRCGNGIPVEPDAAIHEIDRADIVILPELWLGPAAVQAPKGCGASAVPARVPTHSSRHTGVLQVRKAASRPKVGERPPA